MNKIRIEFTVICVAVLSGSLPFSIKADLSQKSDRRDTDKDMDIIFNLGNGLNKRLSTGKMKLIN